MASEIDIKILAKDLASSVIKGVTSATNGLAKTASTVGKNYAQFGQTIASAGAVAIGAGVAGLTALGISAIKSADELKQNRIAFETMLGSAEKAGTLLKDIKKFGLATPFENKDLVTGAKQLLAYNVSADKIIPTLKNLGDISAGLGMDKMPVLIRAFGQINAKGKLLGGEMLQLNEAGLNLVPTLAKMRGVSEEAFRAKDITEWKISAKEVEVALGKIAGSKFAGLMAKQSKTVSGMISNLKDFGGALLNTVGGIDDAGNIIKGGLMDTVSEQIGNLLQLIDKYQPQIQEFAKGLGMLFGSGIQKGIELFGRLRDAVTPVIEFIKNNKEQVATFAKTFGALVGLSAVVGIVVSLVNPFTLVLLAITAISVAVAFLKNAWDQNMGGIQEKTAGFVAILQSIWSWISTFIIPLFVSLGQIIVGVFQFIVQAWQNWNITGIIVSGFQFLWTIVTTIFQGIGKSFEIVSLLIQGRWSEAFQKVVGMVQWAFDRSKAILSSLAGFVGNVFVGVIGIIKSMINTALINPLNKAIDLLNSALTQARKLPGMGGIENVGHIPLLAQGVNRVPRDMLAIIHKDESVVPAKMNPFNPGAQSNGIGGGQTIQVIIQGTVFGVDNLIDTVARGVSEAQARSNKLSDYGLV